MECVKSLEISGPRSPVESNDLKRPTISDIFNSMVLEFLEGGSLDGWLHKNSISPSKPMDEVQMFKFAHGIALGMRHLARSHIVHRDVCSFSYSQTRKQ